MTTTIRTGVVGVGGLGTGLARAAAGSEDGEVVAITEIDDDRREVVGDEFGLVAGDRFADYDSMLARADLDAVIIATPHSLHYEQVVMALDAGYHVLCEKPLTVDLEHARDLVRRDDAADEVLMVGYQRHIQGPYRGIRQQVEQWSDPPRFISAEITQNWIEAQAGTWRCDPTLSGGGHLYDTGSHLVDVVLWASDLEPVAVTASMDRWEEDPGIDITATVGIEFAQGGIATISVCADTPQVREYIHFWGNDGAAMVSGRGWGPRELHTVAPDGAERYPNVRDEYPNKVEAFYESIRTGSTPPATSRDALAATAVTEAAYEADETGRRVEVDL